MLKALTAAGWVVRVTGPVQVILGLLFWNGRAYALVPAHMAIGLAFVLGLWTLAALGARARIGIGAVLTATLWGAGVLVLGMTQTALLPGRFHWVIKVLHLAVGLAAMPIAKALAARTRKKLSTAPATQPLPSPAGEGPLSAA